MVISYDEHFFYGRFTGLVGQLLHKLDPDTFEPPPGFGRYNYYVHRHFWDHPYLLKIVQRIGDLALLPGTQLSIQNFELALNEEITTFGMEVKISKVDELSISELKRRLYLDLPLTEDQINDQIDSYLKSEGINLDPLQVKKYLTSIDRRQ